MIQVYTGSGKGKTTAAIGLAVRAAGAGQRVFICQFLKGRHCCELASLKKIKNIKIGQFGRACFVGGTCVKKDIEFAREGLEKAKTIIRNKECDMMVLDEINVALKLKLLKLRDVISFLKDTPKRIELILTGRYAHPEIMKLADLVSLIQDKKHYYEKGIKARKGIEF